jgi:hypothetical protein
MTGKPSFAMLGLIKHLPFSLVEYSTVIRDQSVVTDGVKEAHC